MDGVALAELDWMSPISFSFSGLRVGVRLARIVFHGRIPVKVHLNDGWAIRRIKRRRQKTETKADREHM